MPHLCCVGKAHLLLGLSTSGEAALPDRRPSAIQQQLTALIEAWVQEVRHFIGCVRTLTIASTVMSAPPSLL